MNRADQHPVAQIEGADSHPSIRPSLQTAGAQTPTYFILNSGWGLLFALWMGLVTHLFPIPILLLLAATYFWLWRDARWSLPGQGRRVRKRLPWLLILILPWVFSVLIGPLGPVGRIGDLAVGRWMMLFQEALPIASIILTFALLPFMQHARRFTLLMGVANLIPTLFASGASLLIISGS